MDEKTKKAIIWIVITAVVLLLIASSFGIISFNLGKKASSTGNYANMPAECRPQYDDIQAWKEHLGHHENTKYCLEYFK